MRYARFSSALHTSLCHIVGVNSGIQLHFMKMATASSVTDSCGDWKSIECSRDELCLDVTLPSGQSFRWLLNVYCKPVTGVCLLLILPAMVIEHNYVGEYYYLSHSAVASGSFCYN